MNLCCDRFVFVMAQDPQSVSDFSTLRLLVHVHIFYPQLYPELKECLENLRGLNFDLYVSFVEDHPEIEADIRSFKPDVVIFKCPNRGYDIAPFVDVLNRVDLSDYDLVVKLHTKRDISSYLRLYNGADVSFERWRQLLLSFIADGENLKRVLAAFISDPTLGMVGHHALILRNLHRNKIDQQNYGEIYKRSREFMQRLGVTPQPQDGNSFIAGTMFMVRSEILSPLKAMRLSYDDFPVIAAGAKDELDLGHVLERVLGWLVTSCKTVQGDGYYQIRDPYTPYRPRFTDHAERVYSYLFLRSRYFRKLCRFLFRNEYQDGCHSIKIFKITVYRTKFPKSDSNTHMDQGVPK